MSRVWLSALHLYKLYFVSAPRLRFPLGCRPDTLRLVHDSTWRCSPRAQMLVSVLTKVDVHTHTHTHTHTHACMEHIHCLPGKAGNIPLSRQVTEKVVFWECRVSTKEAGRSQKVLESLLLRGGRARQVVLV